MDGDQKSPRLNLKMNLSCFFLWEKYEFQKIHSEFCRSASCISDQGDLSVLTR